MSVATKAAQPFRALFDRIRGTNSEPNEYFHELEEVSVADTEELDDEMIELASMRAGAVFDGVNWDREARAPVRESARESAESDDSMTPAPESPVGHVFAGVDWDREGPSTPEPSSIDEEGVASQPNTSVDDFFGGVTW